MIFPYQYLLREVWDLSAPQHSKWDVFLSAFNHSDRVLSLWRAVQAPVRIWAVHDEYGFDMSEIDTDLAVFSESKDEAAFVLCLLDRIESDSGVALSNLSIAVDITGFMRAELIVLVQALKVKGVKKADLLYSEPVRYIRKGRTTFSKGNVREVRQVRSCEGIHTMNPGNDLLIMGVGYDHDAMALVAEEKHHADRRLLLGFPSLAPDMYQESVLRVSLLPSGTSDISSNPRTILSPANDPFHTASEISKCVAGAVREGYDNIYLSPLGTKLQVVGFALFYAIECQGKRCPISIIMPFAEEYTKKTSEGIGRVWRCEIEFP